MSNQFIGLTMLVTLNDPPGAQLRGVVSSIEPGKSLTLRSVTAPSSGRYLPEFTIQANEIVELVEAVNENAVAPPKVTPIPKPVAKAKNFEDPAILSVGRKPTPQQPLRERKETSTSMERVDSSRTARGRDDRIVTSGTTLVETPQHTPLVEAEAGVPVLEELEEVETPLEQPAVKTKRPRRPRKRKPLDGAVQDADVTPAKETTRSKGWRNTPLLEPNPSFQPFSTLKRRGKGRMEENGWATEDATDVQELGDFDFIGNLTKFDKHSVFEKMKAEDSIAEEDRLVGHNRLKKPGTNGGKNLHYSENVLDAPNGHTPKGTPKGTPKLKAEAWKSEESELDERTGLRDTGSGRQSRRAESKLATNRRPASRKESLVVNAQPPPRALSVAPLSAPKPAFHLVPSDRRCEIISALQMLNLENIADNELGLTEDMMTENAGRGIAEVALSALNTGGRGLIQGKAKIATVVVFAGNNKSGMRAVAAGRHIRNHGLTVVVCVLGIERENELLVGLKKQIKVFRGFGGKVFSKIELLDYLKREELPVELIIDGLLGLTISFEELRTGDQATAYELIEWANRSKTAVLAIDIPTGIDPTSGKINIIDGIQLYIHAKFVVAMGAPKKGLLEAMAGGEGVEGEWQLFVADLGLGENVWKKGGTRVRRGVEFEGSWVVGMRFQGLGE